MHLNTFYELGQSKSNFIRGKLLHINTIRQSEASHAFQSATGKCAEWNMTKSWSTVTSSAELRELRVKRILT